MSSDHSTGTGTTVQQRGSASVSQTLADELISWFTGNGGQLSNHVQIVYSNANGFHMRAKGPLSSVTVATCPLKMTLSCLNLDPDQTEVLHVPSFLHQCLQRIPENILTYLFLIEQRRKGKESPWHAYIACLPSAEAMTTPLWFEDDDFAFLAGTSLAPAAKERKREYHQHYQQAIAVLKAHKLSLADDLNFKELLWAATIFTSRAFISTHIIPGRDTIPMLFPVVDILNHSVHAKAEWDFKPYQSFSLNLLDSESYIAGQELFNNYAPKQNDELLLGYGFCLDDNPIEQFSLKLVSPVPEEYARQLGLLEPHNVPFGMDSDFLETDQTKEQQFLRARGHPFGRYGSNVPFFRGIPPYIIHSFFMQTMLTLDIDLASIDVHNPGARITIYVLALLHHAISMRCITLPLSNGLTPRNDKQRYAQIYRDGQAKLIHSIRQELETVLLKLKSSSLSHPTGSQPTLLHLAHALKNLTPSQQAHFQSGVQEHNLTSPEDDTIIWILLLITSVAHTLTSTTPTSSANASDSKVAPAYLSPAFLATHPLPTLETGITDAKTYTFIDDNIGDFLHLNNNDPDGSPMNILDDVGLKFMNKPQDSEEGVFVNGKTENLGIRLIMWGMSVVERELVPVRQGEKGGMEMCLFCAGDEGGDGWMFEDDA